MWRGRVSDLRPGTWTGTATAREARGGSSRAKRRRTTGRRETRAGPHADPGPSAHVAPFAIAENCKVPNVLQQVATK